MPAILKSMITNPHRIGSLLIGLNGLQHAALKSMNISEDEWDKLSKGLPGQLSKGQCFMLPWKDAKGRLQPVDMSSILPWGNMFSLKGSRSSATFPTRYMLGNPILGEINALQTNMGFNSEPIVSEFDDGPTKFMKRSEHILANSLSSVVTPFIDLHRTLRAGKSDRTVGQWVANNIFGIKINPTTESKLRATPVLNVKRQLDDARKLAIKKIRSGDSRAKVLEEYRRNVKHIKKEK